MTQVLTFEFSESGGNIEVSRQVAGPNGVAHEVPERLASRVGEFGTELLEVASRRDRSRGGSPRARAAHVRHHRPPRPRDAAAVRVGPKSPVLWSVCGGRVEVA